KPFDQIATKWTPTDGGRRDFVPTADVAGLLGGQLGGQCRVLLAQGRVVGVGGLFGRRVQRVVAYETEERERESRLSMSVGEPCPGITALPRSTKLNRFSERCDWGVAVVLVDRCCAADG